MSVRAGAVEEIVDRIAGPELPDDHPLYVRRGATRYDVRCGIEAGVELGATKAARRLSNMIDTGPAWDQSLAEAMETARREEREACARLIERWHPHSAARKGDFILAEAVTRAIRARGDQ